MKRAVVWQPDENEKSAASTVGVRGGRGMEETMNKRLKKAAVLGLSAALAMSSLAGCSKKEEKVFDAAQTAVTVNGTELSAGVVKFMTHYMQAATESFYNQYFGAGSMNMAIDENGTTLGEMMKEQNISSLTELLLIEQHMEEYGVSLTDEEKAAITEAAAAFIEANDEEVLTKMGATQADVERYLELNTIQVKMNPAMSADVDTEVSDAEAAQRKIQYVLITAETEAEAEEETEAVSEEAETETEDSAMAAAMEEAYAKAVQAIELIKGGEEFEEAVQSIDEDLVVREMTFDAENTTVAKNLIIATEGLADDTLVETPVEGTTGYYVVKLVTKVDREATDEKKEELVEQRKSDRITELLTEWKEAAEITQDDEVIAQIIFDFSLALETETEAETDAVSETEAVTEAESGTEEVTEAVTEAESGTEKVTEAVTEAESETEA